MRILALKLVVGICCFLAMIYILTNWLLLHQTQHAIHQLYKHKFQVNLTNEISDYWKRYRRKYDSSIDVNFTKSLFNVDNICSCTDNHCDECNISHLIWVKYACPNVFNYFENVKYFKSVKFKSFDKHKYNINGVLTTQFGAIYSCLLEITVAMLRKCDITHWIYAGTSVGAYVHGGLMPWDDDVDIAIDKKDELKLSTCAPAYTNDAITLSMLKAVTTKPEKLNGEMLNNITKMGIATTLMIDRQFNAYKVQMNSSFVSKNDFVLIHERGKTFLWPYIDLFVIDIPQQNGDENVMACEVRPQSNAKHAQYTCYDKQDIFPLQKYFFNNIFVNGPQSKTISKRYDTDQCVYVMKSHRLHQFWQADTNFKFDCQRSSKYFPKYYHMSYKKQNQSYLVYKRNIIVIHDTNTNQYFTINNNNNNNKSNTVIKSVQQYESKFTGMSIQITQNLHEKDDPFDFVKKNWFISQNMKNQIFKDFQNLSLSLIDKKSNDINIAYQLTQKYLLADKNIDINKIEINNNIYDIDSYNDDNKSPKILNIIEINAERGTKWIDLSRKLQLLSSIENREIDIIILNEMDIGMARSNNIHTTRLLAESLNMNFAFGVEFIELTNGNQQETVSTKNMTNRFSIHGNAILCKCKFLRLNSTIFRSKIEAIYFSNKKAFTNANGFEKRIGGRMAMFVEAKMNNYYKPLLLGSIHKLHKNDYNRVKNYIDMYQNDTIIIVGGDQSHGFCPSVGLKYFCHKNCKHTWPSNCETGYFGQAVGDIICSNENSTISTKYQDQTLLPCIDSIQLSDHAFPRLSIVLN